MHTPRTLVLLLVTLAMAHTVSADGPPLQSWLGTHLETTASLQAWTASDVGVLGPALNAQRTLAPFANEANGTLADYLFATRLTGGNLWSTVNLMGFITSSSAHTNFAGGHDITAIGAHTHVQNGSTARGYGVWAAARNYSALGYAVGAEIDVVNARTGQAPAQLSPGATTGLAVVGLAENGGSQNTYGVLLQSYQGQQSAFRTGIHFEPESVVQHANAIVIPNETWLAAHNANDTAITRLLTLDGLNDMRIGIPNGGRVRFVDQAGNSRFSVTANGVDFGNGCLLYSDNTGLWTRCGQGNAVLLASPYAEQSIATPTSSPPTTNPPTASPPPPATPGPTRTATAPAPPPTPTRTATPPGLSPTPSHTSLPPTATRTSPTLTPTRRF